jgi:hypothetical protein
VAPRRLHVPEGPPPRWPAKKLPEPMGAALRHAGDGIGGGLAGGLATLEAAAVMVAAAAAAAAPGAPLPLFSSEAFLHRPIGGSSALLRDSRCVPTRWRAAGAGHRARTAGKAPESCCRSPWGQRPRRCAPGWGHSAARSSRRFSRVAPPPAAHPRRAGGQLGVRPKCHLSRWARRFAAGQVVLEEAWRAGWLPCGRLRNRTATGSRGACRPHRARKRPAAGATQHAA